MILNPDQPFKMEIEITKQDIKREQEYLINHFGRRFIQSISLKDFKEAILLKRLKENIKTKIKKGLIIYKFDKYKNKVLDFKEYIVYSIGSKNLLGNEDIVINKEGGYIAGGLNGRAVLKNDWLQYKQEVLK